MLRPGLPVQFALFCQRFAARGHIPVELANDASVLSSGQAVKDLKHVIRAFYRRIVELTHGLVMLGLMSATRPTRCTLAGTFQLKSQIILSCTQGELGKGKRFVGLAKNKLNCKLLPRPGLVNGNLGDGTQSPGLLWLAAESLYTKCANSSPSLSWSHKISVLTGTGTPETPS